VLDLIPGITSAVDLGCGTGEWLAVLHRKGVEIKGYDGNWVLDAEVLQIPPDRFAAADLNGPVHGRSESYDLAISVETAEHLEPDSAMTLVQSLTRLSDVVLFSAAIPSQGGVDHINEQWPSYWAKLFDREGYEVVDAVRSLIWDDERVAYWYRQNILLFLNRRTRADLIAKLRANIHHPLCIVHPDLYSFKARFFLPRIVDADISVRDAFKLFLHSAFRAIKRRLKPRPNAGDRPRRVEPLTEAWPITLNSTRIT
jgi:hypothetical protein